mmetsp:Transcript_4458/g.11752  ORF Transcript_4458/g.11752 Transcript_4458/m.11752 type:complete len:327 (+) Transcript_4458:337-1317(+)
MLPNVTHHAAPACPLYEIDLYLVSETLPCHGAQCASGRGAPRRIPKSLAAVVVLEPKPLPHRRRIIVDLLQYGSEGFARGPNELRAVNCIREVPPRNLALERHRAPVEFLYFGDQHVQCPRPQPIGVPIACKVIAPKAEIQLRVAQPMQKCGRRIAATICSLVTLLTSPFFFLRSHLPIAPLKFAHLSAEDLLIDAVFARAGRNWLPSLLAVCVQHLIGHGLGRGDQDVGACVGPESPASEVLQPQTAVAICMPFVRLTLKEKVVVSREPVLSRRGVECGVQPVVLEDILRGNEAALQQDLLLKGLVGLLHVGHGRSVWHVDTALP